MSLKLLTLLALGLSVPDAILAQNSIEANDLKDGNLSGVKRDSTDLYKKDLKRYRTRGGEYKYNTFTSGDTNVHKFDNKSRAFKDWSISLGGGVAFLQGGDLTSFYDSKVTPGYNFYVSLDKQISHAFGLSLQYQFGQTKQRGMLLPYSVNTANGYLTYNAGSAAVRGVAEAETKYRQVSILGDINFSNLFRRVDNRSTYRWALHGYAGLGLQGYDTYRKDNHPIPSYAVYEFDQAQDIASFFYQAGLGLKFNLSKFIDLEARVMYVISGDDEFDGGGDTPTELPGYNMIVKNESDNMLTANLGLSFKLGKKGATHLSWYDPMQEIYYRAENIKEPRTTVCEGGDNDNDGVCDDWDRQLNTPAGARVDGAGVALDLDLDGVIDLHDKCVTVPGPVSNNGCPNVEATRQELADADYYIENVFKGIEFELDKDVIRPSSFDKLNQAAEVLKNVKSNKKYLVIGATDTRASQAYNLTLSQKRANAVVKYLVDKGVNKNILIAEGRGKKDLKYPECDPASECPEWKNEANRRVYFKQK